MINMLEAIFGAVVVGDFLLAVALFALWKESGRIVPPPKDGTGGE